MSTLGNSWADGKTPKKHRHAHDALDLLSGGGVKAISEHSWQPVGGWEGTEKHRHAHDALDLLSGGGVKAI